MDYVTSYFGFAVTNPTEGIVENEFFSRRFDPKMEPEGLAEIVKGALDPDRVREIAGHLVAPETVELAEGNQRTFLSRFGLYPAIEKLIFELSQDGVTNFEIKQHLEHCLKSTLEKLKDQPYQVAPERLPFKGLGRIDPAIVKSLLKEPCGDPNAEHGEAREPSGFLRVDGGEALRVPLLLGETKHLVLKVRHAGPCVVQMQHFSRKKMVGHWNLIVTELR